MAGGTLITGSGNRTQVAWSSDKGESRLSGVSADSAQSAFETAANKLAANPASKLRVYNRNSPDRELVLKRKWIFGGGRRDDTAQVVRQLAEKASGGLSREARQQFMQSVDRVLYSGEGSQRRAVNLKGSALQALVNELKARKSSAGGSDQTADLALESRLISRPQSQASTSNVSSERVVSQLESTTSELRPVSGRVDDGRALISRMTLADATGQEVQDAFNVYVEPRVYGSAAGSMIGEQKSRSEEHSIIEQQLSESYIRERFSISSNHLIEDSNQRLSDVSQVTFTGVEYQEDDEVIGGVPRGLDQAQRARVLEHRLKELQNRLDSFDQTLTQPYGESPNSEEILSDAQSLADAHHALTAAIEAPNTDIDTAIEKFNQLGLVSERLAELKAVLADAREWLNVENQRREELLTELNQAARGLHDQYAADGDAVFQFEEPHPELVELEDRFAETERLLQLREPDMNAVRLRAARPIQEELNEDAKGLGFTSAPAIFPSAEALTLSIRAALPERQNAQPIVAVETLELKNALGMARIHSDRLNDRIEQWVNEKDFVETRQLSEDGLLVSAIDQHLRILRDEKDRIDTVLGSIRTVAQPAREVNIPQPAPVARPESPPSTSKASPNEPELRGLISRTITIKESKTLEDAQMRFNRAESTINRVLTLASQDDIAANRELRNQLLKRFNDGNWLGASFAQAKRDITKLYNHQINELVGPQAIVAENAKAAERQRVDKEISKLTGQLGQLENQLKANRALSDLMNQFSKAHLDAEDAQTQIDTLAREPADDPSLKTLEQLETLKRTLATARSTREALGTELLPDDNDEVQNLFSVDMEDALRTTDDFDSTQRQEALAALSEQRAEVIQGLEGDIQADGGRIMQEVAETESLLNAARQEQARLAATSATGSNQALSRLRNELAQVEATAQRLETALDAYQKQSSSR